MAIAKAILAPDLSLIQGPPGSGKSTAIAELIWQHVRENQNTRILLTSETNLAVDNAIDRVVNPYHNLVKPIRIGDESRMETEGLQFSYSAMYRWAKGEDITAKKKSFDIDDDEQNTVVADTQDLQKDVEGKMSFAIMDFRNVTHLFADPDWDGPIEQCDEFDPNHEFDPYFTNEEFDDLMD